MESGSIMLKGKFYFANHLKAEGNLVTATIELNPLHEIYRGHFKGNPVTPGVCQIQIIKEMICEIINQELLLKEAKNIKFLNVLSPSCKDLHLNMEYKQTAMAVDVKARLSAGEQIFLKFSGKFIIPDTGQ
jgi:3-hydroxyacyl-[acyl-carrier-protein] dehydratase